MDDLFGDDVVSRLQILAKVQPTMALTKALDLVMHDAEGFAEYVKQAELWDSMPPAPSAMDPNMDTMNTFIAWVRDNFPTVQTFADEQGPDWKGKPMYTKTIHAIKELRAKTGLGLKEAKETVFCMRDPNHKPWGSQPTSQFTIYTHADAYNHI